MLAGCEHLLTPQAVHQGDLDINEKILRHFDLSSQYGVRYPHTWPRVLQGDKGRQIANLSRVALHRNFQN